MELSNFQQLAGDKFPNLKRENMKPTVLVPIADGTEEIEAVCIIDVLRRADIEVTVARVATRDNQSLEIVASRGVLLRAEMEIAACSEENFDALVIPGGLPGAEHLRDDATLTSLLKRHHENGKILAAICAAPAVVLQHHGLIGEHRATCYPGMMNDLPAASRSSERVVSNGTLITSRGPGTALEFSVELVRVLCGSQKGEEIAAQLLI